MVSIKLKINIKNKICVVNYCLDFYYYLPIIEFAVALSLLVTCVVVQVSALHVCADPDAAVAEIVYPVLHALQSTVASSHNVAPDPDDVVGVPFGHVHILTLQVCAEPEAAVADIV